MSFGVFSLLALKLNRQTVPLFEGFKGKHFPQRIPATLTVLCFLNSLVKLLTPLILQQTYSSISRSQTDKSEYFLLITVVIASIALSQLLLIAYTLTLSVYRLNVKRELSSRILENNFVEYKQMLESTEINEKKAEFDMELAVKISTKLSVYLHNYYDSYLSLIFECFNIVVIFVYLLYKLNFSLFFGVGIAALVMYKTLMIARKINEIRFSNIARRGRRLKILEDFFNRITEFKMCWLDKWIYDKITQIEHQFQHGLRKIKMLDCWCVALWQFTSVGISSIVISAYFLLGFNQTVDKGSVFTPSTFVYLLGMLNFPLNALSWYIAGMKTAYRAIQEIKKDIQTDVRKQTTYKKISQEQKSFVVSQQLSLTLQHHKVPGTQIPRAIIIPKLQLPKGKIYSIQGNFAELFLDKLVFLFDDTIKRGFVEENSWLSASPLQAFRMELNASTLQRQEQQQILRLMQLFQCGDIPLATSTKSYSGGQKLRISLVRAFNLGEVIIINTNTNSLDTKMQHRVKQHIRGLVQGACCQINKHYTVFIRDNEDISDFKLTLTENSHQIVIGLQQTKPIVDPPNVLNIQLSSQVQRFKVQITAAIENEKKRQSGKKRKYSAEKLQKTQSIDKMQEQSVVSWSSFKLYYKSPKHILFLVSIVAVTIVSNYYNYYVNTYIKLSEYNRHQVFVIIALTVVFGVGLFFRSFFFADANLDESVRICHNLNKNVIMNELSYYASQQIVHQETSSAYCKSKMICALSSDTQTISDAFPFSTNIFANNVMVILSSIIVIIVEVPPSIVLIVFLVIYANQLNRASHKKDEYLQIAMKEKDVDVYRVTSQIQNGKKYILIHHKLNSYTQQLSSYHQELYSVDWLSIKFKSYVNLKYKIATMLFLVVAVAIYSFFNIFGVAAQPISKPYAFLFDQQTFRGAKSDVGQTSRSSSGLALLIQYTIQLSNYLLYFVMSIWQIKGQAVSFERIRPYIEETQSIQSRISSADKIVRKFGSGQKKSAKRTQNKPLINISQLDFAYDDNPEQLIFKKLNLKISTGDRIIIRGRSGSGKTTLYKLLTSAYPKVVNLIDEPFNVYFSPQHPLVLPDTERVLQNIDPYKIAADSKKAQKLLQRYQIEPQTLIKDLNYEQKIIVNNLRAYLYGSKGVIIYDEPQIVIQQEGLTYLIVTHHRQFSHNVNLCLQNRRLETQNSAEGRQETEKSSVK